MNWKSLALAAATLCVTAAVSTAANAAATFGVTYFQVPTGFGGDFGICCSSPPATLPVIALGSALGPDGLPVTTLAAGPGGGVIDQDASGQILWWKAHGGVSATGTGTLPLPLPLQNMFAPNATGSDNVNFFLTAILSGTFTGHGATSLTVSSDDDAFVYLDGLYVGGIGGVHGTSTAVLDLGNLGGNHNLKVFYADRARVDAKLALTGIGLDDLGPGVPEPATWAMMIIGFGAAGTVLRRRKGFAAV